VTAEGQRGGGTYVQALALGLDPSWRREPDPNRREDGARFAAAEGEASGHGVRSLVYSSISLQPDVDLLLGRTATSVDALEAAGASLLKTGLGRWLTVRHSLIGRIGPSQYVRKPTGQEQSAFAGDGRYLVVYPFTKSTAWYLTPAADRQQIMNEHMKIGHQYPSVRQALAYSFGLDDQDFVVAYETDDLAAFGDLVRALRGSESRRETVSDTPILLGVHRPLDEILALLGAS
jgi:chlorite dismutase